MVVQRLRAFLVRLSASEVRVLIALGLSAGAILLFLKIVDEIILEGEHALDRTIVLALRTPDHLHPIGPRWAEDVARDITSLGSTSVLTLAALATIVFLWLTRQHRSALYIAFATSGGTVLVQGLKQVFGRTRPDVVPEIAVMASKSFPSGHATMSALTYLVLAALVARKLPSLVLRSYVMGLAMLVTILVGASRVYLGYHWPSDVVAGWTLGAAWALLCWGVAEWLEDRRTR